MKLKKKEDQSVNKIILKEGFKNKSCANQLTQRVRELEVSLMSRVFRFWNHTE